MLLTRIAEKEMNEARLRMARIPAGADLILNKVRPRRASGSATCIVMAGVPSIMQAMLDEVAPTLKTGVKMLSETVRADCARATSAAELGEIAKAHPDVMIGSYPFLDDSAGPTPISWCARAIRASSPPPRPRSRTMLARVHATGCGVSA